MFNKEKLFNAISNFGGAVMRQTAQYVPAMLSEDKRFSNAYAACLALLVCADMEVEADETIAAIGFMQNDRRLKDRNLVLSTLEFYGKFIDDLSGSFGKPTDYILKKAKIIQEHINVDLSPSYKEELRSMSKSLIGRNAAMQETQVLNDIIIALG